MMMMNVKKDVHAGMKRRVRVSTMVDYQSYYRLYALGLTSDPPRVGVRNLSELYHETGRKVFEARSERPVHDCRHELMKEHADSKEFETWLLSYGLKETFRDVADLYCKERNLTNGSNKVNNLLLYKLGKLGSDLGDFHYPRGVCTKGNGDILIADARNNRIQHFTRFGVFVGQFGCVGEQEGEFSEPSGIDVLLNGDIAVADSLNQRMQLFTESFIFKYQVKLPGNGQPYSLKCSRHMDIVVATSDKRLHLISTFEKAWKHSFPVGSKIRSSYCPVQISVTHNSEIVVSDVEDSHIYTYSQDGTLLRSFKPSAHSSGLTMCVGSVCVTPAGHILVADVLNRVVNEYTDRGEFLRQVLSPTESAGPIHSLVIGPEGHLIVTEFSVGGDHCVKIFRFGQCLCHDGVSPAKKRTL